jgi:hypothetical protein
VIAFRVRSLTLEIVAGDICAQDTDAIVNAANSELFGQRAYLAFAAIAVERLGTPGNGPTD